MSSARALEMLGEELPAVITFPLLPPFSSLFVSIVGLYFCFKIIAMFFWDEEKKFKPLLIIW